MLRLRDFKNFPSAEVDLSAPLTILLGRNGTGKTNLIEGVELLAALVQGVPLHEISETDRGGPLDLRGGLPSCPRFGASTFGFGLQTELSFGGASREILYELTIGVDRSGAHFDTERLSIGQRRLLDAERAEPGFLEVTHDDLGRGASPRIRTSGLRSVLSRYWEVVADSSPRVGNLSWARRTVDAVRRRLQRAFVLDPVPNAMREYERATPRASLAPNGSGLSATLFALSKGGPEQQAALGRITDTIRQIEDEPFRQIGFVETSLGDVIAGLESERYRRSDGDTLIDTRLLSNGTLRMLAVLTALETVPATSRLVIENIDRSLHPHHAGVLAAYLPDAAARRRANVLVTTHGPAFMNALSEPQFERVSICHRDDTAGRCRVTRLASLEDIDLMSLYGGLGDQVTRGRLEKRLDSGYEERRRRALQEWIASVSGPVAEG